MSENNSENGDQKPAEAKTFTQEEVDRMIGDRLKREDVFGLRAKAEQFDRLQESSKSDMQKLTDQLAQLKLERDADRVQSMRYRVAAASGITNEDADLFLTGSDEDTISAQAKRLVERVEAGKKQGNYVPNEGKTPTNPSSHRGFTKNLFGGGD